MAYRRRRRSCRDPETGITYARQKREVAEWYRCGQHEKKPHGAFDLADWAQMNDPACDPRSGGLANPTSMAAAGGVSQFTLVNSVVPLMSNCLHREGPVLISTTNSVVAACREYRAEQWEKQHQAGKQHADNLNRWDPSSGSNLVG